MLKYTLIFATFAAAAVIFIPQEINAQWTNPYETYRTNDLIRRMPKKKPVRKAAKKASRRTTKKSSGLRKKRASFDTNIINRRYVILLNHSKRPDVAS